MIKVLFVGGNKQGIPQLSGTDIHVDYVQNGMIALSAAQTQDFDIIIIEDQLPLMTPMRLIKELVSIDSTVPECGEDTVVNIFIASNVNKGSPS